MRRIRTIVLTSGLAVLVAAATSTAATPSHSAKYSGTGADFMNNAPHWTKEATGRFSFKTSKDGKRILAFRGTYSYYCGAGTATITARYLLVSKSGRFDFRFSQKAPDGGRNFYRIYGRFLSAGEASVAYFDDFTVPSQKVKDPYDTGHPHRLGCASWVRGIAKTR